jgi:hypothetical protein
LEISLKLTELLCRLEADEVGERDEHSDDSEASANGRVLATHGEQMHSKFE